MLLFGSEKSGVFLSLTVNRCAAGVLIALQLASKRRIGIERDIRRRRCEMSCCCLVLISRRRCQTEIRRCALLEKRSARRQGSQGADRHRATGTDERAFVRLAGVFARDRQAAFATPRAQLIEDQPTELAAKTSATDEVEEEVHHVHQVRGDVRDQIHHRRGPEIGVEVAVDVHVALHRLPAFGQHAKNDQQVVDGVGQGQDEEGDRNGDQHDGDLKVLRLNSGAIRRGEVRDGRTKGALRRLQEVVRRDARRVGRFVQLRGLAPRPEQREKDRRVQEGDYKKWNKAPEKGIENEDKFLILSRLEPTVGVILQRRPAGVHRGDQHRANDHGQDHGVGLLARQKIRDTQGQADGEKLVGIHRSNQPD